MKKRHAPLRPLIVAPNKQSGVWQVFKNKGLGSRFLYGALLLVVLAFTRWAWIDCDGGTPSLTEYGYFTTDEGYYCGGGKNQYLFDQFVNVLRASPNTYAICPALHAMTWGAFSIFGQTTWAHRVFPLLINTLAWGALFYFLSRRTRPWLAFLLCSCCVLNPFLMVYGRTACSDTVMASLVLIGYVLARGKGFLFPFLGGCVFGLGLWVKQSIWVLVALGLSGALTTRTPTDRIRRAIYFAVGFVLSALVSWGSIRLLLFGDAFEQGVTVTQLLAMSKSSYPLPNIFDWSSTLRGISAFPRVPTDGLLGIWVPLFLVLPALLLLRKLTEAPIRWDARLILYATLPLYSAGIMILPVYYAHYFIPVIAFIPVLWFEARRDLKLWHGRQNWMVGLLLLIISLAYIICSFRSFRITADKAATLEPFLTSAVQLPQQLMWMANGKYVFIAAILLTAIGIYLRQHKFAVLPIAGIVLSAFGVADLCYALLPLSEGYPYCKGLKASMKDSALMLQVGSVILFFIVWGMPLFFRRNLRWVLLLMGLLLFGMVANPVWRNGACELTRQNQLHKKAVAELARIVPENGVVFGERAPQLFLSLKTRVAAAVNANPVTYVMNMHREHPDRPLFAILDFEHDYHIGHYQTAQQDITVHDICTLQLPSFRNNKPVKVLLVRLDVHPDDNQAP